MTCNILYKENNLYRYRCFCMTVFNLRLNLRLRFALKHVVVVKGICDMQNRLMLLVLLVLISWPEVGRPDIRDFYKYFILLLSVSFLFYICALFISFFFYYFTCVCVCVFFLILLFIVFVSEYVCLRNISGMCVYW